MKKISNPIVFFGSGPVASESLELLNRDFSIEVVITKPKPPHHKGDVPVLTVAKKLNLPIITVQNKDELNNVVSRHQFQSKVAILVDFGIIVSELAIDAFPLGIINSHFSLLPAWRGADPITFSILKGDQKTGVSLMLLVEAMDEGPLLKQVEYPLPSTVTTPELTKKLVQLSYTALRDTLPGYINGNLKPYAQNSQGITYSRRLSKEDGIIDWRKPAAEVEREIRAFAGWPKSKTSFNGFDVVITKAHVIDVSGAPGQLSIIEKMPVVHCGDKALVIDLLKPANKKK